MYIKNQCLYTIDPSRARVLLEEGVHRLHARHGQIPGDDRGGEGRVRDQDVPGFKVLGLGSGVQGWGFRVWEAGFGVEG